MLDFKKIKVGDHFVYRVSDFDAPAQIFDCTVLEVHDDHIIANVPTITDHAWFEPDNPNISLK